MTEAPSFTCPVCGATSYHPEDVRHSYCGRCHAFTGEASDPGGTLPVSDNNQEENP